MKIAIPAAAPKSDAHVENRLGAAAYLLVIDTEDMSFEAMAVPSPSTGPGSGIKTVAMVMDMGATAYSFRTFFGLRHSVGNAHSSVCS